MSMPGSKPWHHDAVYPVSEAFELGRKVLTDKKVDFQTGADTSGVLGCVFTKLAEGSEPDAFGAGIESFGDCPCGDPRTASDDELLSALESGGGMQADGPDAVGAAPSWLVAVVVEILRRGLDRLIERLILVK
jgi:hypothetical protein